MKNLLVGICFCCLISSVFADITPLEPFNGDASENFTSLLGSPFHVATVDVFDGDVTLNILGDEGSIFIASGSSLGGDQVNAYSPPLAIAQLGIMEWEFHRPITRFGAYFENNSRFDDATLDFYDINGDLIGSANAIVPEDGQQWVWNAWESTSAIHRIISRGHDVEFLSGFIWFDNVEISFAPLLGDVNLDGAIDLTDVQPFVDRLVEGDYQIEADMNGDGMVDLSDVHLFVQVITP